MGKYRILGAFLDRVFRNDLNKNFDDVDADIKVQKARVDNLIIGNPQPEEVMDLRTDTEGIIHGTAWDRFASDETKKATKFQQVDDQLAEKAELTDLNSLVPKRHVFGGQIKKLKESLSNPLEQFTGIVFLGDSITWGRTLVDNATYDPRYGNLNDARDNFSAPSFVNEFKRYIGKQYAYNTNPLLSNWATSPTGESIVEYELQHILYPKDGDFTLVTTGTLTSVTEAQTPGSVTGFVYRLGAASSGTGQHSISFNFTGDRFTLCYTSLTATLNYELFVDGVSKGIFSTIPNEGGNVSGNDNRREHVFNYVRNKSIEIVTRQAGYVGTGELRIEGIIVNKKIRISNQGIIGATSRSYLSNALPQAVDTKDNFIICQIGTNDRIINSSVPKGENTFKGNLAKLLSAVTPLAEVILMCANPSNNDSTSTYSFSMQRVRDVVYRTAKESNLDMIDNYAIFSNLSADDFTADGLHPNELGHKIIARNIVNSIDY